MSASDSVFAKFTPLAWPHQYKATIVVDQLVGGIPSNDKVTGAWIQSKLGADAGDLIRHEVTTVMAERGMSADEAAREVTDTRHLNGFKRDEHGLYIEGRQMKACLKEAASVAMAAGKLEKRGWGQTNKGILSFVAEHIQVVDDRLYTGRTEADGILQRFVHTFRGNGIQYEEYVEKAELSFTVQTDHQFTDKDWAMIWLTAEQQGVGASRSQGYGRFTVTKWEKQ